MVMEVKEIIVNEKTIYSSDKYIPIIQMVGMLFNNILYCFSDIYIISYLLDFIIGNSITTTFLLYVCSYVLVFVNGIVL